MTSWEHVLKGLCDSMGWCFYISHHFATFSSHEPCGSSNAAAKIVYRTLEDLMIKGSGDFMEGKLSLYIPTLPILITIDIVLMDI